MKEGLNEFSERLSHNMRDAIAKAGMTQTDVAMRMGIALPTLNRYLKGDRNPAIYFIWQFCDVLNISIDDLVAARS